VDAAREPATGSGCAARLRAVAPRDRIANLGLLGLGAFAWVLVALLFVNRSPDGDLSIQLLGSGLLGAALGLCAVPLFWLAMFARHRRIAYRGDWTRAARRGAWVGTTVALFVALRTQHALSLPLALFVLVMVVFVEISLSVER